MTRAFTLPAPSGWVFRPKTASYSRTIPSLPAWRGAGFSVVGVREACYAAREAELKRSADILITNYAELFAADTAGTLCDSERKDLS